MFNDQVDRLKRLGAESARLRVTLVVDRNKGDRFVRRDLTTELSRFNTDVLVYESNLLLQRGSSPLHSQFLVGWQDFV